MTAREVMTRKPGGTARLLSWETGRQGAVEQRSAGIYACRTAWGSADCALRVQAVPGMESSFLFPPLLLFTEWYDAAGEFSGNITMCGR